MDYAADGISQLRWNIGNKLRANKNWQSRKFYYLKNIFPKFSY